MEKHPEQVKNGLVRKSGETTPFNAGDAMAFVCAAYEGPIPRSFKARLGKAGKELLEDGFDPNVVCAAMIFALRIGRPHLVPSMAVEIQSATNGQLVRFAEYRRELDKLNNRNKPELQPIYEALRGAFK